MVTGPGDGRMRMIRCFLGAAAVVVAAGLIVAAQSSSILPIVDHIHLNVPDQAKGVEWYQKTFGGTPTSEAPDRLMLGDTRLIFLKNDKAQPSAGSALDHIGFSVADLDAKMKELESAGVKVVNPVRDVPGLFKLAFVEDPWGTRIEVVQDPEKVGLHHVHLRSPDPAGMLAWYVDKFGGSLSKLKGRLDGINYGGVWMLAQQGPATPSAGHSIDHMGMRPVNVDNAVTALKAKNVKVTTEPRPLTLPSGVSMRLAFIEGPEGVRIELVQR